MDQQQLWEIVKPRKFFPVYAPGVKNYYRKITGVNTRNNPLSFTDEDKLEIREGVKRFFADAKKVKL